MAQSDVDILADIDRLQIAKGRPERTIELSDGRRISFRSIDELNQLIADKQRQLSTGTTRSRQYRVWTSKGY